MSKAAKSCYLFFLAALTALQIGATLSNTNLWPISSFNVFSSAIPEDVWVLKVILLDADGKEEPVDPGRVLPIEFFKARSIIRSVFLGDISTEEKDQFARRLLVRLEGQRWREFDEILSPAAMRDPTQIRVEAWQLNRKRLDSETGFSVARRLVLYASPRLSPSPTVSPAGYQ